MTKTIHLFRPTEGRYVHYYCATTLKKLKEGTTVFHEKVNVPAICVDFVKHTICATPDKISVTVSTEEISGAKKVFVTKAGFHRWYYDAHGYHIYGGVSYFAEEILHRLFPTAPDNGLDTPHPIWLKFK